MKKLTVFLMILMMCGMCLANLANFDYHWRCNDNLATTAVLDWQGTTNLVLNDASGTATTAFHSTGGVVNTAFTFDGSDDYLQAASGSDVTFAPGTLITWTAWIKPSANNNVIISKWKNTIARKSFRFGIDSSDKLYLSTNDSSSTRTVTSTGTITAGVWSFVAATLAGEDANETTLYINGTASGTGQGFSPTSAILSKFRIGSDEDILTFFTGDIDNVMIFSRALSAAEIRLLYNSGHGTEIITEMDTSRRYGRRNRNRYTK